MWSSEPWVQYCSAALREDVLSRCDEALSEFNPKIHVLPLRTIPNTHIGLVDMASHMGWKAS